jgi:hypothetical protein
MKAHPRNIIKKEGKNPASPVATGRANIPPPIVVPATKSVAPKIVPFFCIVFPLRGLFYKKEDIYRGKIRKESISIVSFNYS